MFIFECENAKKNCLVMFLGQYSGKYNSVISLSSEIQLAYRNHLTPEVVILLVPKYLNNEVKQLMDDESIRVELTRHQYSSVNLYTFNEKGDYQFVRSINAELTTSPSFDLEELRKDVCEFGYKALMDDRATDVLAKAPAGTNFVKPSGKVLEEFIYASQLARSSCEYQFLAMSLLNYMPTNITVDCIYIDTASISAVAEALTYYIAKFDRTACKHVKYKSFSSYSGLEKSKPDDTDGAWIIISASESTNMGKQIVKDWGVSAEQVITILSHKEILSPVDKNIGNAVVFCINDYSSKDAKNYSPVKVQVHGESFSVEASPPQEVLLLKVHGPKFIDGSINKYRNNDIFSVNRNNNGNTRSDKPFLIYTDYIKLREHYLSCVCKKTDGSDRATCLRNSSVDLCPSSSLYQWIEQIVQWSIPNNLKGIVIGDGDAEQVLLTDFKSVLSNNNFNFSGTNIQIIKPDDHEKMTSLKTGSVLILSTVISSGNCFVDVNRSLRLANHNGMRIFATTFTTSPSRKKFKDFQTSVTQGTNGFKYSFYSYKTIHIGHKKNSSWIEEKKFITNLVNDNASCGGIHFWMKRKTQLEKGSKGLEGKIGVSYEGIFKNLEFAPDFVFWPSNYSINSINLEAVYVTVASILQNLRDDSFKGMTLNSSIYQHSVMSPDNFIRFNDSVLQSSLWRCATPSELDYRRSDVLSSDFQGIMTKIMSSNGPRSYICLDLLLAIGIRWIKVSERSLVKILEDADKFLIKPYAKILVSHIKKEFNLD